MTHPAHDYDYDTDTTGQRLRTQLQGRTALVTGASRGLGRAIAVTLAGAGAEVFVHYRLQESEAHETLQSIENAGGIGRPVCFDLREAASIHKGIKALLQEDAHIDILVNNAGVCRDALFPMMTLSDWQEVIDVNVTGAFLCCQAVVRGMMGRRRGAIVNVASVAGFRASIGQANYAASKAALLSLTQTLAAEVAAKGIRVNAVIPGLVDTGMVQRMDRRTLQAKRDHIPMKRMGTPEEVAKAVLFLASEDASYITGQALVIDGGLSL